jgi:hypothetical protein
LPDNEPLPQRKQWEFRHLQTGEVRMYEQRELSIDGEVQLFGLANRAIERLSQKEFPWHKVRETLEVADSDAGLSGIDWNAIRDLVTIAMAEVPELGSEMVTILLGIFPTDERGNRNKDFEEEVKWLRGALKFERLIDMLQVFGEQNEYKRLALPFVGRVRSVIADAPTPTTTGAQPENASQPASTSL